MPDIEDILKILEQAPIPSWMVQLVWISLFILLILIIWSKIKDLWITHFLPIFYKPEAKRKTARRRRFADHIESEIRRLNNLEAWSDYRFAELEAEVEAEGRRHAFSLIPFFNKTQGGLRREKTLSKALEKSAERLILLEGDPGSGKSVALRYVTQSMARRAMKARNLHSIIPIYINLKEFERKEGEVIDRTMIYNFVLKTLNRVNDRDIEEFLEDEFDEGLRNGTWFFLFDSFDELPDVLSSTEADTTIRDHTGAISDFLHGMNQCRGVVASRYFRGPGQVGWPRFRILALSESRRLDLIKRADLKSKLENDLVGQLGTAGQGIRTMSSNPMFLGLLCEHMRSGNPFPDNAHTVFETYVNTRLTRDEARLERRFNLTPTDVRAIAEKIAFSIGADVGLGLSPTRDSLKTIMPRLDFHLPANIDTLLDALEFIKLARSETATSSGESKPFTFAHRRFQEYFSTCVVLAEPERVKPHKLLTDARWRETAVVLCQTQPPKVLAPILNEARNILTGMVEATPNLIDDPLAYIEADESADDENESAKDETSSQFFPWPPSVLHLLSLLQDGFSSHLEDLPDDIRLKAGQLLLSASGTSTLTDKKWALEVAGTVPQPVLLWLLRDAFANASQWLREVAYRQTARLGEIPVDIERGICEALVDLAFDGRLREVRHTTYAHLTRLQQPNKFLSAHQLLLRISPIDLGLHIGIIIALLTILAQRTYISPLHGIGLIIFFIVTLIGLGLYHYLKNITQSTDRKPKGSSISEELTFSLFLGSILQIMLIMAITYNLNQGIFLLIAVIYFLLWTPLSIASAAIGKFTHWAWWIVIPVWPILDFLQDIKGHLVIWLAELRKNWKRILGFFNAMVLLSIAFVMLISPLWLFLGNFIYTVVIVEASLLAAMLLYTFYKVLLNTYMWLKNQVWWYKFRHTHPTSITEQVFLDYLALYTFNMFRSRLVSIVRAQNLLSPTKDAEKLIESLALTVERDNKLMGQELKNSFFRMFFEGRIKESIKSLQKHWTNLQQYGFRGNHDLAVQERVRNIPSTSEEFTNWYKEYVKKNKNRLAKWGPDLLDEICKLLEHVRASRQNIGE